jgi:hypothetical protein
MSTYKFLSLELSAMLCDDMYKSSAVKKDAHLLLDIEQNVNIVRR